jgi:hypothetical protein
MARNGIDVSGSDDDFNAFVQLGVPMLNWPQWIIKKGIADDHACQYL